MFYIRIKNEFFTIAITIQFISFNGNYNYITLYQIYENYNSI